MPFLTGLINTVLRTKQTESRSASNIWEGLLAPLAFPAPFLEVQRYHLYFFPLGNKEKEHGK